MGTLLELSNETAEGFEAVGATMAGRVAHDRNQDIATAAKRQAQANIGVNFRQFSARSLLTTVDASQNVAVLQALLDAGYVVVLPDDGQVYPINATLTIGDGTTSAASTRSGGIVGAAGATPYGAISTYLKWTGSTSVSTPMIRVNGMVYGLQLTGVGLNCDYKCSGIEILGMRTSYVEDNAVTAFMKFAVKIIGRSGSAGQQVIQNSIKRNICETGGDQANHPVDGCRALWLDGDYTAVNDPWLNVFEGNRFVIGAATNSCARYLGFCDSNVFIRDHFVTTNPAGAGSTGSLFDATGHNGYPVGNYDLATSNYPGCSVTEGGGDLIGVNYFAGYGTIDLETPPTHAKLRGYTIEGLSFNGGLQPLESDIVGSAWTPFTPTLTASVGTITTSSVGARYKKVGRTVHLRITASITTVGTATVALLIGGLPAAIDPQGQNQAIAVNNTTLANLYATLTTGPTRLTVRTAAGAFPLANGESLVLNITYEAAS